MMPKLANPITDLQIRRTKPGPKVRKLADGGGLYLEILPNGSRFWRFRFRQATGKENLLSFGPYPEVGLASAREQRDAARRLLLEGTDPGTHRDRSRQVAKAAAKNTFEKVAREWHALKMRSWTPDYGNNVLHRLECDIFPSIGATAIDEVAHRPIIEMLRKIETRGAHEIAKRNKAVCAQIFSFAIQSGIATRNPIADMRDVLQSVTPGNFPAISADDLPDFLLVLRRNEVCMHPTTRIGLRLLMLVFVRTSELIETPWTEIEPDAEDWTIPWHRMKLGKRRLNPIKKDHFVPLASQTRQLLTELRQITGGGKYMLPNLRDHTRPMSNNAFLKALERMGYKGDMSGHGFRALAMSTIKERLGYRHEVVDRQLAHVHTDKVARAYDRAEFIDERREMMQAWADYLDKITPAR
jgi:integrase